MKQHRVKSAASFFSHVTHKKKCSRLLQTVKTFTEACDAHKSTEVPERRRGIIAAVNITRGKGWQSVLSLMLFFMEP